MYKDFNNYNNNIRGDIIKKLNEQIIKRYKIITYIILLLFFIIFIRLFYISVIKKNYYTNELNNLVFAEIEGESAPRGRIYDRNYKLLVDNVGVKSIYYKRKSGISKNDEISLASKLSEILKLDYNLVTESMIKDLWLVININTSNEKITDEEFELLKTRKITNSEIELMKRERITADELKQIDKKTAYVYYLMNNGYSYQDKLIKKYATDEEYALISENLDEYNGMITKLSWERKYLYGDTLRGIFGNVSDEKTGISSDYKDYYLKKGYKLTDRVGLSGLEYQYEEYLKGEKAIYKNTGNGLELIKKEKRGNDIVLSIDIDLQLELEKIVKNEMIKAKNEPNTTYFNKVFTVMSDPNNGEVLALVSKIISKTNGKYNVYDYTAYLPISSITVGSVIKGASMSVGYKTGVIDIGTKMKDECIKISNTPEKCSWLRSGLGTLSDVDALRLSSNSYQFKIAMMVAGFDYKYNYPFQIKDDTFKIYRNMFNSYGLGVKTGIDLPNESVGLIGIYDTPGLILDFSIGQYDTYTPLQLSQYINTIANGGDRYKLSLLKEVRKSSVSTISDEIIYENKAKRLNGVDLDSKYIKRIQDGFKAVMSANGLGYGYINLKYNPAGKTGTSQSFYDSDFDGIIDKQTISTTFAGYAPYDNPKISIVILSPDISHIYSGTYISPINRRISQQIMEKYFNNS